MHLESLWKCSDPIFRPSDAINTRTRTFSRNSLQQQQRQRLTRERKIYTFDRARFAHAYVTLGASLVRSFVRSLRNRGLVVVARGTFEIWSVD